MRKIAAYPKPAYSDPNDLRLVQIVRAAASAQRDSVNLLGVPFDGAVLGRKGAAGGPSAIRNAMSGFSNYSLEWGTDLRRARIFDLGDVGVPSREVAKAHAEIESEVSGALEESSLLLILGGDNSISLPSLGAFAKKFGRAGLVVIDSHLDLRGEINGRPTSGSSYGLAVESMKGLDPHRVAEIGVHGFLNSRIYHEKAEKLGITVITAKRVREMGAAAVAAEAYAIASEEADGVYLSVDLDAVDLSHVSGVSAPSAGGMSAGELLDLGYEISRREGVKCADIVELAPSLDPTGKSERVAASLVASLIGGFVSRKK